MTGLVMGRLGTRNPARELSVQSSPLESEGILQSGKAWTPGGTECPQLSLESAGLRSFIPKAQSRYSLIERCPAEKDFSFSS